MRLEETRDALNSFGKYVVQQSRSNLTKGKKNSTSDLYKSWKTMVCFKTKELEVLEV